MDRKPTWKFLLNQDLNHIFSGPTWSQQPSSPNQFPHYQTNPRLQALTPPSQTATENPGKKGKKKKNCAGSEEEGNRGSEDIPKDDDQNLEAQMESLISPKIK